MKYGVKIPFPDGEFLWVTQGDSKFHIEPLLFETKEEAEQYSLNVWGINAKVELYGESKDTN
jgi:hypothetical protein